MHVNISSSEIMRIAADHSAFMRGQVLSSESKVEDFRLTHDETESGMDIIACNVVDGARNYQVKLAINPESYRLIGHKCRCTQHLMWKGACDHVVAALYSLIHGNAFESRTSTRKTTELVENFERFWLDSLETDQPVYASAVKVYPQISFGRGNYPYVTLTVGASKRYVVKNIEEFLTNVRQGSVATYGKDFTFSHNILSFDPDSARLINLLDRQLNSIHAISAILPSYADEIPLRKALPLSSEFVDEFFEILQDRGVSLNLDNRSPQALEVTSCMPNIPLKVSFDEKCPVLTGPPIFLRPVIGKTKDYLLGCGFVHTVPKGYVKTVMPILDGINKSINGKIVFPADKLQSFCRVVLPRLAQWGLCPEDIHMPEYVTASELTPRLYFSMDGNEVICSVSFRYGDAVIYPLSGEEAPAEITRDTLGEFRVKKRLTDYGFQEDRSKGAYTLASDDKIFALLMTGMAEFNQYCEVYVSDEFNKSASMPAASKASVGVRLRANLMEVTFDASGYSVADLVEALESYRAKKKFHRLRDGRFINLEDESISDAAQLLGSLELTKKDYKGNTIVLPHYRAVYLESLLSAHKNLSETVDEDFKALTDSFREPVRHAVPAELENILRPYQKIGFQWLKMLAAYKFGGILADDMGLGKTIQVIALLLSELDSFAAPSLVVAPTSLVYNWQKEFGRFAPSMTTTVLTGLPAKRKELLEAAAHVYITTYDTLKRDLDNYEKRRFKYVIADEAQYMKNPATQNASAIKQISAEARFALTGTPVENALSELWSIFDFIMPGYLYTASKFTKVFEGPIIKSDDKSKADELRRQVAPFIMRRLKKDVLTELPEKVETNLFAEMEPEQKKIYAAHLLKARGELDGNTNRMEVLAQLTRLRQICCHPQLFSDSYTGGSGKLELTMETVLSATESGHRILLFSQFTSMLAIILAELDKVGIEYFYLDGKTPAAERLEMTERFNAGERSLFAISLRAGGTGLNLVGADVVMHYDPWWNPAVMNQASDRAHRYGQEKAVQVINIVTKDSIEEKILELQERKKNLVDSVITEGGSFIDKLSQKEILELFRD